MHNKERVFGSIFFGSSEEGNSNQWNLIPLISPTGEWIRHASISDYMS